MSVSDEDAKLKAATTYNSAADSYDDPANSFWERFGRRTIERIELSPGSNVLDVCCGSGASALPAAEIVGPSGSVTGIDLADNLLHLARVKARHRSLGNMDFRHGNILDLPFAEHSFDAVVCVFGIFFVSDMPTAVRELWRVLKTGGKLAITTWGPRFFEPASTIFWNSIRGAQPDLYKDFNPWDRISDPDALRQVFRESGISDVDIVSETAEHAIPSPDAWWSAVLGSGYRGTVDQLGADALERVKSENLGQIRARSITFVEANVMYAVATKRES